MLLSLTSVFQFTCKQRLIYNFSLFICLCVAAVWKLVEIKLKIDSRLHCIDVYADHKDDFHSVIFNICLDVYRGVGEGWRACWDIWIFSWINETCSSDFKQYYSAYTGQFFIFKLAGDCVFN